MPALLEFIARWVPELSTKHRIDGSLIPPFVPAPLRAIYELAGNWPVPSTEQWRPPKWIPGLFGPQDHLLPVDQLEVNGDRFTFIHENQGVWSCETRAGEADPPVYSDASSDGSDDGMREVCTSLSHFLTTFCLRELVLGSRNLFCVDSEPRSPGELVERDVNSLWLNGMYVYEGVKFSFFLCERDLMIMSDGTGPPGDYWLAYNKEDCSGLLSRKHDIRRIH
jgi:hypothetical protein